MFNSQHFLVIRLQGLHIAKNIQSDTESADLQVKKVYAATGTGNIN